MASARNNVTDIGHFSRERRQGNGVGRTHLDECREKAVLGIKAALGQNLEQIKQQLLQQAEKSAGMEIYHLYMDTLELARDQREAIEGGFRKHFLQRFNLACRRDSGRVRKDVQASELSLMAPDDLEQSLAAGTLANAIHNACVEELFGLDKRIGMLINDPDMQQGDNPLGPEIIADAVNDALDDVNPAMKARLLMVAQLSKTLPEQVRDVYREINQYLVSRNVLPTIRVGLKRSSSAPSVASGVFAPVQSGGDVFAMLRQLMGGAAGDVPIMPIAGPAMPGETAAGSGMPAAMASGAAFMRELSQIQRGQMDVAARAGLELAALQDGRVNVLHGLRSAPMASAMAALDAMTLDIVAMVFDYILDDNRIPDAMKALIGRLQIPVLKVAMLDKAFFSQKSQPARRLLDLLAEAAIGWDATEGHEGGLYRKVDELVERILEKFDDRIDVFSEAVADLNAYLSEERREAAEAAAASVQAIQMREVAGFSQQVAHDEVQSCLVGQPVPTMISAFLMTQWQRMMADVHQKAGPDNPAWKGAIDVMNDLIWSVMPKVDQDARRKLVDMLPGLLRRLDEGISYLGLAQSERDRFFSELVKCHAEAVRAGLLDEGETLDSMAVPGMEADIPVLSMPVEFEPVEPIAEAEVPALVETREEVIEELAAEPEIGEAAAAAAEPGAEPALDWLKRGSWIAYRQEDGEEVRAKLSWVSPMGGIYLFTNRHGQRAISINAEGLLTKLRDGSVRVLSDAPLMDRAVDSLMERLQQHAA